ncbi:GGDEF domain-containing protein [Ammoniphilus sp. CFH 90114]|uniref:GGDEF domain-containing protein n=1 Tax=Ammoniphilus sp. CFH 90114 TaxID=2493665 RepID=UPI00100F3982|nr:GGDEF domain-containing protein [Ammoniphilus sp. CFH 90114]RXT03823.1 GGDEF domain-containing protein [Ammoniphilus sp. CFH 90114]
MVQIKGLNVMKQSLRWNQLGLRLFRLLQKQPVGILYFDVIGYRMESQVWVREHHSEVLSLLGSILPTWKGNHAEGVIDYVMISEGVFLFIAIPPQWASEKKDKLESYAIQLDDEIRHCCVLSEETNRFLEIHYGVSWLDGVESVNAVQPLYGSLNRAYLEAYHKRDNECKEIKGRLFHLLSGGDLRPQYQPIYSLKSASLVGYEATLEGSSEETSNEKVLAYAVKTGKLADLHKRAIHDALVKYKESGCLSKLFVNVDERILKDPNALPIYLVNKMKEVDVDPRRLVIEIKFDRASEQDLQIIQTSIQLLKRQGMAIALDQVQYNLLDWKRIELLQPEYIKIHKNLIKEVQLDWMKEEQLKLLLSVVRRMNGQVIAMGVENEEELRKVITLGVDMGQGFALGHPQSLSSPVPALHPQINRLTVDSRERFIREGIPRDIIVQSKQVNHEHYVSEVADYFQLTERESYVIVVQDRQPVGLISKGKLYQRLGTRYGVSLYLNKKVFEIMDGTPLIVESTMSIEFVSKLAMSRSADQLYDAIIVMREGHILGVVTIQALLDRMTKNQIEWAKNTNSLTHLPGIHLIEDEIRRRREQQEEISLIYADLDSFKWYNDIFGFKKGDQVIERLAGIMVSLQKDDPNLFIGHIGGDDFMAITSQRTAESLCKEIIERFDQGIHEFYSPSINEQLHSMGKIETVDRQGNKVETKGVSISLSVLDCDNLQHYKLEDLSEQIIELKKSAKAIIGSVYVRGKCRGVSCC